MTALVRYDEACRALAAAVAVDEVLQIRDKADMMRAAARIAKNRDLEIQAIELRMRGERRLGEILSQAKEAGQISRGRPQKNCSDEEQFSRVTLDRAGIDRKLSSRAQKMAAVPENEFEGLIRTWKDESSQLDGRLTTDLLRVGAEERQREARRNLAQALSDTAVAMTGQRRYAAGYIDPPWLRKQGVTDRSYENHYPTMNWDQIVAWAETMRDHFLDDAWFFLWIPRAHMFALHPVPYAIETDDGARHTVKIPTPLGWAVARAIGADSYSTAFIWTKTDDDNPDDHGSGILAYDQDEVLLMFKKGRGLPKPETYEKFGSNHRERSRPLGHSRKPQFYRDMIAKMTGGIPVLECFARHDPSFPLPPNWDSWGNQASPAAEVDQSPAKADADLAATEGAQAPAAEGMDGAASRLADGRTSDPAEGDVVAPSSSAGEFKDPDAPGCTAASAGGAAPAPAAPPESEPLEIPAFLKRRPDNSLPPRNASEAA